MRKKLVVRYSILVLCLLLAVSGLWAFFWREQLLASADLQVSGGEALSPLFEVGRFIFVIILVLVVLTVLLGFLFTDGIFRSLRELVKQLIELKSAPFTSRLDLPKNNEFTEVAIAANQVIERLEHEIAEALFRVAAGERHFKEEQSLLEAEQKRIYEEKEKLDYVLGRITDGVILLNRNRSVVLLNKAAEEIVGSSQSEAINKNIGEIVRFYEDQREILTDEYISDNAFVKKRVRLTSSHTTEKLVDLNCVRLTLIHTQDLGYMIVLHDLTEELGIEKKQIGLLSSFAQELRQPLSLISNYFSQGQDGNLERARSGVGHLSLILENLLTTSAIENKTITITSGQVDLISIIKDLIIVINPLVLERQISLQYEEPRDINPVVIGDQQRIYQIVLNLLLNAIYHTQAGGGVSVSLSQSGNEIILRIQDTGVGIATEELKNLFNKFYAEAGGIGLGLYVCKKLTELQDGKIWLDSVEGRGTVVSVSLPKVK